MSDHRVFVPARPTSGRRLRGGLIAASAGALMLLGVACGGSAAADEPAADPDPAEAAANIEASAPERPTLVAAAVSEAPAQSGAAALPDWVTASLDAEPPKLALTYPAEGTTFTTSYVMFSGKAEPGSTVAAGAYETKADKYGQWNIGLVLNDGQNVATFTVIDEDGNEIEKKVTVNFAPPAVVTNKHKDGDSHKNKDGYSKDHQAKDGFEAWQKYGSCGESVPYDVFKGNAVPGTTVTITSPYGGGSAVAGDDGYWKVKVTFESAPVGEPFTVTVSDGSEVKTFTFTRKK